MARRQIRDCLLGSNVMETDFGLRRYLLAASGVNPATTLRDLNALQSQSLLPNAQPPIAGWDPDTNKYVAQLQQQSTLKMIAEGIERAHRNFDAFLEESIDIDLELQRRKIYEHFGLAPKGIEQGDENANITSPGGRGSFGKSTRKGRGTNRDDAGKATLNRSIFGSSGLQKSVIGTTQLKSSTKSAFADVAEKSGPSTRAVDNPVVHEKQVKYADTVQKLNRERLRESTYPVLHECAAVERHPGDEVRWLSKQEQIEIDTVPHRHRAKLSRRTRL